MAEQMKSSSMNAWKRPSDVMKVRRLKKRGSTDKRGDNKVLETQNSPVTTTGRNTGAKRKNPFSCSPRKRQNLGCADFKTDLPITDNVNGKEEGVLFQALNSTQQEKSYASPVAMNSTNGGITAEDIFRKETSTPTSQHSKFDKAPSSTTPFTEDKVSLSSEQSCTAFPVDWSLKMKIRFLSSKSFGWSSPLKAVEESSGISAFVRCKDNQQTDNQVFDAATSKCGLQQSTMAWMHPNLPWLRLYPRIVPDNRIGKQTPFLLEEDIQKELLSDWIDSFTSVFQLLRTKHCPFFYVCTHQFTVLFRAAGLAGHSQVHAILTPTTRGLREALSQEGIEYSMPLDRRKMASSGSPTSADLDLKSSTPNASIVSGTEGDSRSTNHDIGVYKELDDDEEENDEDEDIICADDGAVSWLQSIGLDKSKFPSLEPHKIKMHREGFKVIDNRPESLVFVEGSETQALFNFLLNCRSCIATTGAQAGVPPTILAPVAFRSAVLKAMKVKHGMVKQQSVDGTQQHAYTLEVTGAIMPNTVHSLCQLFQHTQEGDFSVSFSVHDSTTPFNAIEGKDATQRNVEENAETFGLNKAILTELLKDNDLGKRAMREIVSHDNLYTWGLG